MIETIKMAAVYTKIYKRLKLSGFPLQDRLRLLKYAWKTDSVNIPNKEQDLIDVLISLLVSRKQNDLSDEETGQVWECLRDLLSTKKAHIPYKYGQILIIKPILSKVLLETIQSYIGKRLDKTCYTVVYCCQTIITSAALSHVITSKYDSLAALLSVICNLTCQQWMLADIDQILQCLLAVLKAYIVSQRQVLNQLMVRQTVTDKLLLPLLSVWYCTNNKKISYTETTNQIASDILHLLKSAYFHQNHLGSLKKYLIQSTEETGKSASKQEIITCLYNITHTKDEVHCNLKDQQLQEGVCQYIAEYYQASLHLDGFTSSHHHKILCILCDVLGFSDDDDKFSASLEVSVSLKGLYNLLRLTQESNVYNVASDNENGKIQLKYYTNLLTILMSMKRNTQWYQCVMSLFQINHEIIHPRLPEFLSYSWLNEKTAEFLPSVDILMAEVITTYGKLNQQQNLLSCIFAAIDICDHPRILTMAGFCNSFAEVLGKIHQSLMTQMWCQFIQHVKSLIEQLDNCSERVCLKVKCVVYLFQFFLCHISVVEYSVSDGTQKKVVELLEDVYINILHPMFTLCVKQKNENLLYSSLLLCVAVGDFNLLLTRYTKRQIKLHQSDLQAEPSRIHSFIKTKYWKVIKLQIESMDNKCMEHLWDLLSIQKIRNSLIFAENKDSVACSISDLLPISRLTDIHTSMTWDGTVESVTRDNGNLSRWVLITQIYPLVMSYLSDQQVNQLAQFIIACISNTDSGFKTSSNYQDDKLSFFSESMKFLHNPQVEDCRKLHSAIMNYLLKDIFGDTTNECSKKKKVSAAMIGTSQNIEWHKPMERETLSCLTQIVSTLLKRLESEATDQHLPMNVLKTTSTVLKILPLGSFKEAEKLRTIYVCIIISSFLEKKLKTLDHQITSSPQRIKNRKRKADLDSSESDDIIELLKDYVFILTVLLESCNRVAVFQLLSPSVYLNWIIHLYSQSIKWDLNLQYITQSLVDKSCYAVLVNVDVLLTIGDYIKQLSSSVEDFTVSDETYDSKFCVLSYLVKELTQHYDSEFVRTDVQMSCNRYVKTISHTVKHGLTILLNNKRDNLLTPHLINLLRYIVNFRCISVSIINSTSSGLMKTISFVLNVILKRLENKQLEKDLKIHLMFLSTLYANCNYLSSILTQETSNRVWHVILDLSKSEPKTNSNHMDCDPIINVLSKSTSINRNVTDNVSQKMISENCSTKCETSTVQTDVGNEVQSLMALVISSSDVENFKKIIYEILKDISTPHSNNISNIKSTLFIWREILSLTLSPQQGQIIIETVPIVLMNCDHLLQEIKHLNNSNVITNITIPILSVLAAMMSHGKTLMTSQIVVLCLNCCHLVNLDLTYMLIVPVFKGLADIVYSLFINHESTAITVIPTIISITKLFLKIIAKYGAQDKLAKLDDYKEDMTVCANLLTRLCNLYSKHKTPFGKVAMYIIADYCTEVQKVTLLPIVKKALVPGIYHLLDICDQHRIKQLQSILPQGVRDVFLMLHNDYSKYYKYTGKS